jgi:hypothetical protein
MRKLTFNNYLFLIPMLFLGPLILFALILHGLILDRYYRAKRWIDREPQSARIIPINSYLARRGNIDRSTAFRTR